MLLISLFQNMLFNLLYCLIAAFSCQLQFYFPYSKTFSLQSLCGSCHMQLYIICHLNINLILCKGSKFDLLLQNYYFVIDFNIKFLQTFENVIIYGFENIKRRQFYINNINHHYNKNSSRQIMNSMAHYKDVKQLTGIIDSYEKKLDDKVNQMYNHIINISNSINETSLPIIENKRISSQINYKQSNFVKRKTRAQSIGSKSFVVNNDTTINQEVTQADYLFKTFKDKMEKSAKQKKNENSLIIPLGTRAMGGQVYVKPKILRKKPQILSKQMRWDPFYEKNAIKAQQLKEGMLSLIQKGKVGKNIDIITAFQKGRPILQTHQAIFHHAEQKFTDNELMKSQINPSQKTIKRQVQEANYNRRRNLIPTQQDGNTTQLNNHANNSWAITIPEDSNFKFDESKNLKKNTYLGQQIGQLYCIQFLHYKLKKDQNFDKMKKFYKFHQNWGQVMEIINQMQRNLKLYNIDLVYCSGNKILQLAKRRYSLSRIQINDLQECLIKNQKQQGCKKRKFFNLLSMNNKQSKRDLATAIVTSAFLYTLIRNKYMTILRRKKYQNKIKQWILNGRIIKEYRRELQKSRKQILKKFQQQQKHFRSNFASIQQKKHFQIHIVNRQYMNKFKYFQEYCCTEITRIFNLENNNTNIIYVSPFQLNVQTINYYFKIMELEQIENYSERVTFLELQDITSKIKLPMSMNTSQKLYFNSKALRKLKRKIQRMPAYFVTNYPSQIDIKLSVYLGIPIYSGDFYQINPIRSLLNSEKFSFEGIESTPCLPINPKQFNVFQLSNYIIKYCEANKKCRKYVIKINNHHFSSGLALLAYPFNSLHEMYGCTALIQPYYFRSIEKFYSELVRQGGVIQKYEEGTKTIAISAKISENQQYSILGTFQRISIGFVNVGYVFPQKIISHKTLISKCDQILQRLASLGHLGYVQLTINVNIQQQIYLQQIQLYSTKITNSLYYFKFLAGGYLNNFGQFMTKVSAEGEEDEQLASMQSRSYCYIPFILHYGLSEKQTGSFFQLCRIGGISFDLQSKYGTTFIILGSLKNTVGIITTAKDKKNILKLVSKSTQFLMKQNSHNISTQMLKQKQQRAKERFSINSIKDKIQQL